MIGHGELEINTELTVTREVMRISVLGIIEDTPGQVDSNRRGAPVDFVKAPSAPGSSFRI